ncbi:MAG TPA: ABC transporter permease, partial [Rhodanobacteraceae bacterium]|nr:ABC transporter permease [Rhodanobacteraceae bacterium]
LDYGRIASAILGLVLFASALTAIGLLCSAWTPQPALAAAAAFAITSLLAIIDAGARLQGVDNTGINYLALPTHVEPFFRGLVASVDIVYFLLIVVVALALTARRLDRLRSTGG